MSETRHLLASANGIATVIAILYESGNLCPDCEYGTRATSKRWAACKRCGRKRIPRKPMSECGVTGGGSAPKERR